MELTFNNKKVTLDEDDAKTFDYLGTNMSEIDFSQNGEGLAKSWKEYGVAFYNLSEAINAGNEKKAQDELNKIAGFDKFLKTKLESGKTVYDFFYGVPSLETERLDTFFGILKNALGFSIQQPEQLIQPKAEQLIQPKAEQLIQPKAKEKKKLAQGRLYMEDHYFDLGSTKERVEFIALGAAENKLFGKEAGVFSDTERNTFSDIAKHFFNPARIEEKKAVNDYEAFNERINALASEVRELNLQHGRFISDDKNFNGLLNKEDSYAIRLYVSGLICPEALRSKAISDYINTAVDNGAIKPDFMRQYLAKGKEKEKDIDDIDYIDNINKMADEDLKKSFKEEIRRNMVPWEAGKEEAKAYQAYHFDISSKPNKKINLKFDQREKVLNVSQKVKEDLSKTIKDGKAWRRNKNSFTWASLKGLNNIYDQFNKEGNILGGSKEYKDLLRALKAAHTVYKDNRQEYMSKGDGAKLSADLNKELRKIYNDVAEKAMDYLQGKRSKRSSEERYEIAFSALALTAKGEAKHMAEEHNYFRDGQKVKKVALNDLIQRSEYNNVTAYKRVKKNQEKLKLAGKMINGM